MKTCARCNQERELSCFGVDRKRKDGRNPYCKSCKSEIAKEFRKKNAQQLAERQRQKRAAEPERFKASEEKYRNANREKRRSSAREWSRATRAERAPYMAEYRRVNREKRSEYNKSHYEKNKTRYRAKDSLRRAKELSATPPWLTAIQKAQMQEMYDISAAKTVQTGTRHEVDHIHPLVGDGFSGLHVPWNLQVIPMLQNRSKGNKLPPEQSHMDWISE